VSEEAERIEEIRKRRALVLGATSGRLKTDVTDVFVWRYYIEDVGILLKRVQELEQEVTYLESELGLQPKGWGDG
jgi:hypothetical protein